MEIGVQRFAVLLPVEHQGETAGCDNGTRRVGNLTGKGTQVARKNQATPEEQKAQEQSISPAARRRPSRRCKMMAGVFLRRCS